MTCGSAIVSERKKRYCSKSCRPSYCVKNLERPNACEICGIAITQSRNSGNPRKTCSRKCRSRKGTKKQQMMRVVEQKQCRICNSTFASNRKAQQTCSKECSRERARLYSLVKIRQKQSTMPTTRTIPCGWCGEPRTFDIRTSTPRAYHEACRIQARRANYRVKTVKRQGCMNPNRITHEQVIDTYGSNCHICKLPIDTTLPRTSKQGLTVDHVIPLSKGGKDEIENLRPAHWICNNWKSDKILEDLNA